MSHRAFCRPSAIQLFGNEAFCSLLGVKRYHRLVFIEFCSSVLKVLYFIVGLVFYFLSRQEIRVSSTYELWLYGHISLEKLNFPRL